MALNCGQYLDPKLDTPFYQLDTFGNWYLFVLVLFPIPLAIVWYLLPDTMQHFF